MSYIDIDDASDGIMRTEEGEFKPILILEYFGLSRIYHFPKDEKCKYDVWYVAMHLENDYWSWGDPYYLLESALFTLFEETKYRKFPQFIALQRLLCRDNEKLYKQMQKDCPKQIPDFEDLT